MRLARVLLLALPCAVALACDREAAPPAPSTPAPPPPPKATSNEDADARPSDRKAAAAEGKVADGEAKAADGEAKAAGAEGKSAAADAKPAPTAGSLENAAVFVVRDKGFVVLSDAGFAAVPDSNRFVSALERGADGKLYTLGSGEISRFDGAGFERIVELAYDTVGSVQVFEVDREGHPWVAGSAGVSHHDGTTWTTEPPATFGKADPLMMGLAVDADDRPWLVTADRIFQGGADGWKEAPLPKGSRFFQSALRSPAGTVYFGSDATVYRTTGPAAVAKVKVGGGSFPILGDLAFSNGGIGAIRSDIEAVSVFEPATAVARYRGGVDFKLGSITEVAVDDRQRVWVVGDAGVAVVGPDKLRHVWRSGTIEEIAGPITAVLVQGRGPELPDAGAMQKGGLRGRVVDGEKGVAAVAVELRESPNLFYSRTPCTGAPTHLKGKTDADGAFTFEGVPLGAYGFAVKIGRKWQITMGSVGSGHMKPGETHDIGEIQIATK